MCKELPPRKNPDGDVLETWYTRESGPYWWKGQTDPTVDEDDLDDEW